MTNRKTTGALFSSVIALILCCAMLVGSTFAWFTDSASTSVHTIQSGKLDVALVDEAGNELTAPLAFQNVDGSTDILWEPGATFQTQKFKIQNNGNLALKYEIIIKGAIGDVKLLEVIDFKLGEENVNIVCDRLTGVLQPGQSTDALMLIGTMRAEAGNEYQNLKVTGIQLLVNATQMTSESDSFDNQYDHDAVYPDTSWYNDTDTEFVLYTHGELAGLAKLVNEGNGFKNKTIKLGADIDLENLAWTPIGNGSNGFNGTFDGNGHTIRNLVVHGDTSVGLFGYALNGGNVKNLTVKDAYVEGHDYAGVIMGRGYTDIVNCHVENATIITKPYWTGSIYDGGAKAGGIIGQMLEGAGNTVIDCSVKNVRVYGFRDIGGVVGMVHSNNTATGNTATDVILGYVLFDQITADENENAGAVYGRVSSSATVSPAKDSAENKAFTQVYAVYDALTLKSFANFVNGGNTFKDQTVVMVADIDLKNELWTPIGNWDNTFEGTFDGQGHTISNLYIHDPAGEGVGLFGVVVNATIKNVTLHNVEVNAYSMVAGLVGAAYPANISDCHITGEVEIVAEWAYVAGVAGYCYYGTQVDGCSVIADDTGLIQSDTRNAVGGITAWLLEGNHNVTDCHVKNLNLIGWTNVGGITGFVHYNNTIEGCSVENVTLTKTRQDGNPGIGLIAGGWSYSATNAITLRSNTVKGATLEGTHISYTAYNVLYGSEYGGATSSNFVLENNSTENITNNLIEVKVIKTADELKAALAEESNGKIFILKAGTYEDLNFVNPASYKAKNLTIIGEEGTIIDGIFFAGSAGGWECNTDGLTIKNVTFTGNIQLGSVKHKNILIENCTFNNNACVKHVAEAGETIENLTVRNCTFNGDGSGNATAIMLENATNVTVEGCEFNNIQFNVVQGGKLYGTVLINNNEINGTGDRVFRFVTVDADITISNNTIVSNGDADGELAKASSSLAVTLSNNTWNGKTDAEVADKLINITAK